MDIQSQHQYIPETPNFMRFMIMIKEGRQVTPEEVRPGILSINQFAEMTRSVTTRNMIKIAQIFRKELRQGILKLKNYNDPYFRVEGTEDIKILPIDNLGTYGVTQLNHVGMIPYKLKVFRSELNMEELEKIAKTGIFGGMGERVPTYLQPGRDVIASPNTQYLLDINESAGREIILLEIDLNKLKLFRDIYHDPEVFFADSPDNEYPGKAFMVFGGIPVQCITNITLLKT